MAVILIVRDLATFCQSTRSTRWAFKFDELGPNFMVSVVKGIQPRDQIEAMLPAQWPPYMATMRFARRLAHVDNIPQQDSAERRLTSSLELSRQQMEALKRYRTGGEQKVCE